MTFDPSIGDGAQLMDIMQLQATLAGYSLADSQADCVVTPADAGGLAVDVSSGSARLGGPAESVGPWSDVALPSADPDDPRKALVYLDATGDVQTLGGIAMGGQPDGEERTRTMVPVVPVPDEEFLPLAEVWIAAGVTDISPNDISSRRMPFPQGEGSGLNADLHRGKEPYTNSDAKNAAPVQSVNDDTGDISVVQTDYQEFQSDGSWSKPSGEGFVIVELWGAGGAGGMGSGATDEGVASGGSGGGGGAYVKSMLPLEYMPNTVSMQVGSGESGENKDTWFGDVIGAGGGGEGTSSRTNNQTSHPDLPPGGSGGEPLETIGGIGIEGGDGGDGLTYDNDEEEWDAARGEDTSVVSGAGGGGGAGDSHVATSEDAADGGENTFGGGKAGSGSSNGSDPTSGSTLAGGGGAANETSSGGDGGFPAGGGGGGYGEERGSMADPSDGGDGGGGLAIVTTFYFD